MNSFFKRFSSVFLFFILLGFSMVSCSKKEIPAVIDANRNGLSTNLLPSGGENDLIVEDSTPQGSNSIGVDGKDVFDKTSDLNSKNYNEKTIESSPKRRVKSKFSGTDLSTIKKAYEQGNYEWIVGNKFKYNQLLQAYYKGLSYYNLAVRTKNNRIKRDFLIKAKKILRKVGNSSKNTELSSRAIFWYGVINFRFPKLINKGKSKDELVSILNRPFDFINTKYPNTRANNDATLYKGMTYHRYGSDKEMARPYYEELTDGPQDDLVYHFKKNKMYPPAKVAKYYLALLDKKNRGESKPSESDVPFFDPSKDVNKAPVEEQELFEEDSDKVKMSDDELEKGVVDVGEMSDVKFDGDDGFVNSDTEVDEGFSSSNETFSETLDLGN